jgi:hypothetical protein
MVLMSRKNLEKLGQARDLLVTCLKFEIEGSLGPWPGRAVVSRTKRCPGLHIIEAERWALVNASAHIELLFHLPFLNHLSLQ